MTSFESSRIQHELFLKWIQGILWEASPETFRLVFVSEQAERILGYSMEEWLSEGFWVKHLHPEDRERIVEDCREATMDGHDHEFEYRMVAADGRIVWFRDTVFVEMYEGQPIRLRGIMIDISQQKHLESEVRQSKRALEATQDELQKRLGQSQRLEAIGQLAGGIAHDFNNLLTIILGHTTSLLEQTDIQASARQEIEGIRYAANRGSSLIRQLLAFERQKVMLPSVLNVKAVVQGSKRLLKRTIGKDIILSTAFSAEETRITADRGQIEQILVNLVLNARDAMPDGGRITIAVFATGPNIILTVSDTGIGIDSQTIAHIFEPFFTTKSSGTGLGLANVYAIVKQYDGDISVESRPGEGTTFRIQFPRSA